MLFGGGGVVVVVVVVAGATVVVVDGVSPLLQPAVSVANPTTARAPERTTRRRIGRYGPPPVVAGETR